MHYPKVRLILTLIATLVFLQAGDVATEKIEGDWHLRVMDGYDVRKVRAILDFQPQKMKLEGFDACNRISGKLVKTGGDRYKSKLLTTRMACRGQSYTFVSKRLHETIENGFTIKEETRYGIEGLTIKSAGHDLFFKRMGE
jgi:heat shock protein HslJ